MEIDTVEGAITVILKLYEAHFDIQQKSTIYCFMKFAQFEQWMIWYSMQLVKVSSQGAVYFFKMSYTTVLYTRGRKHPVVTPKHV